MDSENLDFSTLKFSIHLPSLVIKIDWAMDVLES